MAQLKIRPLLILKGKVPRIMMYYALYTPTITEMVDCYVYSWYIEGAEKRILVDAAILAEAMHTFTWENVLHPVDALKRVGTSPDEIDLVICTHLHSEHIGSGYMYKNAKFIVQKAELDWAFNTHPTHKHKPTSKAIAPFKGLNFQLIEGDTQIVEGVRILHTPGHTPGSQSVMVDTEKGKAIISGLCSRRENFEPPEPLRQFTPVVVPGNHSDLHEAFTSMLRIKEEADIVIPTHDPEFAQVDTIG
jgi:N-acyl homoserine lactone hydrolase